MNPNQKIDQFFNIIYQSKNFAYDVETNGLKWQKCYVCGYGVSNGKATVYIPVRHAMDKGGVGNIDCIDNFENELSRCIDKHPGKIIGHNIKFDSHMGENHGIKLGNKQKDTMTREALLNEHKRSYSLENTAKDYNIPQKKGKELYEHISNEFGVPSTSSSMGHYHRLAGTDPIAVEYAEADNVSTFCLFDEQEKEIYGQNLDLVEDMESELSYILQKMERKGISVDLEEFQKVKIQVNELHLEAHAQIPMLDRGGLFLEPINPRSNKDLKEYFEYCEIDDWPYTNPSERHPDGQPSFTKDWLATNDPGILIMNARKYSHLISQFIEPFESFVYKERIHCSFNQTRSEFGGTKPGRLSCYDPNLQQVPKRDKQLGKIYRRIFKADPNYILVEYDHSQAEPRLYAHYSGEKVLIDGYSKTPFVDMHSIAAQMMGVSRDVAKNLNLGMLYTMGAPKLAKKLGIELKEAYNITRLWYRTFRNVSDFSKKAAGVAETRGYVRTILGRRARFPDPRWAYRAANRIIQGSSADILKYKMVQINRWIEKNNYDDYVHMLLNIHDALLFQIHKDYLHLIPEIGVIFASVQEPPFNLKVPFYSDYHQGENWSEASYR